MDENGFSLEDRVLCSDGACIGVVDSNGLCKVCGKVYEGDETLPSTDSAAPAPSATDQTFKEELEENDSPYEKALLEAAESAPDPSERVCCPDETCIGIIGPDGRCGTCGKTL